MKKALVGLVVLFGLAAGVAMGQEAKGLQWLNVKADRFEKETTVSTNIKLLKKGVKSEGLKGVNIYKRPGLAITVTCPDNDDLGPNVFITFISINREWEYLECHSLNCLVDNETLQLPKSIHDGSVEQGGVTEMVSVLCPTMAELEKMWDAKTVEIQICNTEFTLSPIEMRMLQELKKYFSKQK